MLQWIKKSGTYYCDYRGVELTIDKPRDMLCYTLKMNGKKIVSRAEVWQLQEYALSMLGGD